MILHFIAGLLWIAALIFAAMFGMALELGTKDRVTARVLFAGLGLAALAFTLQVLA